ncbi:tetratricopeptide repeat protein [Luteolibacter arcticus]|uniref:Tetratricopeptide repeat protein n=1 Tax=Luteolibacter arcticus TaxID=1581411 RepID=A0ABT3GS67_9BACT|nr:tetratricopeptide repeat protein [Luteolibacter arcticus]MCW1926332.1 tetratricopeptide repeat protein [Luteolibacter arcticus]
MFRRTLLVLPLATMLSAAPKPAAIPAFKEGLDALSARLWEVATARFETALATPDLDAAGRQTILLRLAETRIRAGESAAALKTLEDPALTGHAELAFWKGQALAAAGRLQEALAELDGPAILPAAPHCREALFTRAALLQALGNPNGALEALAVLTKDRDAATFLRARLESADILLSQGRAEDALLAIPPVNARMTPRQSARAELLRAQAQLEKGEYKAAHGIFSALLAKAKDDPAAKAYRHEAAVGLARAQLAAGNREAATDGLIAFIEEERESPKIGLAFPALLDCFPATLAADDVILTRLREWCPPPVIKVPAMMSAGNGGAGVWPASPMDDDELATQALYHLALGLRREGSPPSKEQARRLLTRLRLDYPKHPLAERALLENARWDLADGRNDQAAAALAALDGSSSAPALRAEASISAAASAFAAGDYALASGESAKAASLLDGDARRGATLNEAIARLAAGDLPAFQKLMADPSAQGAVKTELELERALFLVARRDSSALATLDRFILDHPDHPRLPEARLAAGLAALESTPPDPVFATAQLDSLSPEQAGELPPAALALARIKIADREQRWADAVALAQEFLTSFPNDPRRNEFRFELGNAHYENGDYNDARLALAKLAAEAPDAPQAEAALLLAARSSALVTTPEAKQESLVLFDKVIARKGDLADAARLMKARALGPADAAKELLPWFEQMKKDHPLRLRVGLELGDALYNSAVADPAPLAQALKIYETLLAELPADSRDRPEIEYQRGRVLELLPDAKLPTKKREAEALDVYFSVLEAATRQAPADWRWVDRCGVRALKLLETAQRWEAAIGVAEMHAKLASPGAPGAAERAKALKLEHFVWDEE